MAGLGLKINLINKEAVRAEYLNFIKQLGKEEIKLKVNTAQITKLNEEIKNINAIVSKINFSQIKGIDEVNTKIKEVSKNANTIKNNKLFDKQSFIEAGNEIEKIKQKYKNIGQVNVNTTKNPLTNEVSSMNVELKQADGIIEKIKYDLVSLNGKKGFAITGIKEVDKIPVIREKQLQAEQKINSQINKQNLEIEKQIQLYRQQANIKIQNLQTKYGSLTNNGDISKQILEYKQALDSLNTTNFNKGNLNNQFKQIEANVKSASNAIKATKQETMGMKEAFTSALSSFSLWIGVATLFMQSIREIKHGIDTVVQLDKGLNNINLTLDGTNQRFNDMGKSAMDFSLKLNGSLKNTLDAMAIFSNLNATVDEILEKSKPSMILSNLTGNSISQSADALQAYIYTFDLTADKASHLSDVITNLAANTGMEFTRSIESMTSAASRGGAVAHEAGLSAEQFMAIISTVNEQSRLQGETIAAGLTTVMSRITRVSELGEEDVSKLETGFKKLGIQIRDGNGEFLDMWKILQNINNRWGSLNSTQKSYVAEMASGVRQKKIFLTLMNEFATIQERATNSMNAEGFAMERNSIYTKSIQARLQNLRNVADETWISLLNSNGVKTLISDFTNVISVLGNVAKSIGLLPTAFSTVTTSMILFNRKFRDSFATMFIDVKKIPVVFKSMSTNLNTATISNKLNVLRFNVGVLGNTFKTVAMKSGIFKASLLALKTIFTETAIGAKLASIAIKGVGLAFNLLIGIGITMVISKIITSIDDWIHHTEKLKEANEDLMNSYKQNTQQNNDMISYLQKEGKEYDELSKKTNLTTEEQTKLKEIKEKIGNSFPELVNGYNKETGEIELQSKSTAELIELLKEKNKLENNKLIVKGDDILEEKYNRYKEYQGKIAKLQTEIEGYTDNSKVGGVKFDGLDGKITKAKQELSSVMAKYDKNSEQVIKAEEKLTQLQNERKIKLTEINTLREEEKSLVKEMRPLMNAMYNNSELNEFEQKLANLSINPLKFMENGKINTSQLMREVENFKNQIESDPNYSTVQMAIKLDNPQADDIAKYFDAMVGLAKTFNIEPIELTKMFPLKVDKPETKRAVEEYVNNIKNEAKKATGKNKNTLDTKLAMGLTIDTKQLDEAKTKVNQLAESAKKLKASMDNIKSVQGLLATIKKDGITTDVISTISEKYPQYIKYLTDEKTLRQHLNQQLETYKNQAGASFAVSFIEDEINSLNRLIQEYEELSAKENKSAQDKIRLSQVANQLKGKIEGLIVSKNKDKVATIENTNAIDKHISMMNIEKQFIADVASMGVAAAKDKMTAQVADTDMTYSQVTKRIKMYVSEADALRKLMSASAPKPKTKIDSFLYSQFPAKAQMDLMLQQEQYQQEYSKKMSEIGRLNDAIRQIDSIYNSGMKKINIGTSNIGSAIRNSDSSGSKKGSNKSTGSKKEPTKHIYDGKPLDLYEAKLKDINKQLENYGLMMDRLTKLTAKLQEAQTKDVYSRILDTQTQKVDTLHKKQKLLNNQQADLIKTRNSKIIDQLQKMSKVLNGKHVDDIARMTEVDWANLYNSMYGRQIDAGYDEKGEARQKLLEENAQKFKSLIDNLNNYNKELQKKEQEILDNEVDITNAVKERVEWQEKLRELTTKELIDKTGDIQDKIDLLEIKDKYNWQERIKLHKELLESQKAEQNFIKDGIEKYKIQLSHLRENTVEWSLIKNLIEEYNEKLDESNKIIATQEQKLKEVEKMQLENLSTIEDKIVSALKKKYEEEIKLAKEKKAKELLLQKNLTEEQLKLIKDGSKTALEIFEEEHNKKIELLNDELKAYEEIYNAKIKEIDRTEDKDSYEKDLNKKQQEKAKLQATYDSLLMDNSDEAKSKKEDLLEQIAKKEEEINEFVHKRDVTLRKQNLQDELEEKKKAIQKQIDEENKAYKKAKDLYDQEVKALEKSNEEKLKAEKLYAEARRLLMEGNLDELKILLEQYGEDSERIFGSMGDSIKKNIIDNLRIAIDSMKELANSKLFPDWEGRQTDENGNQIMRDKPAVSKDKQWTIKMNKEIDEKTLKDKVYVLDEKGNKVDVDVSLDNNGKNIVVTPIGEGFEKGHYQLVVEKGLKSKDGKELKTPSVRQEFDVNETGGKNHYNQANRDKLDDFYKDPEYLKLQQKYLDSLDNPKLQKPDSYWKERSEEIRQKYKTNTPQIPQVPMSAFSGDNIPQFEQYLSSSLNKIKMPTINIPTNFNIPKFSAVGNTPVEIKMDNLINIEGNADKSTLPEIRQAGQNSLDQLRQALNKQGVRGAFA